jgi:hypothetical protein
MDELAPRFKFSRGLGRTLLGNVPEAWPNQSLFAKAFQFWRGNVVGINVTGLHCWHLLEIKA